MSDADSTTTDEQGQGAWSLEELAEVYREIIDLQKSIINAQVDRINNAKNIERSVIEWIDLLRSTINDPRRPIEERLREADLRAIRLRTLLEG